MVNNLKVLLKVNLVNRNLSLNRVKMIQLFQKKIQIKKMKIYLKQNLMIRLQNLMKVKIVLKKK